VQGQSKGACIDPVRVLVRRGIPASNKRNTMQVDSTSHMAYTHACARLRSFASGSVWYMNELHLPTYQTLSGKFVYGEVFDDGGVIWRSFTALACAGKPSNSARRRVVSLSDA